MFEKPTIRGISEEIEKKQSEGKEEGNRPRVVSRARVEGSRLPLSFAQQRLWFLYKLLATRGVYNIPLRIRLEGELDVKSLERSFTSLVERHEILRTRFAV